MVQVWFFGVFLGYLSLKSPKTYSSCSEAKHDSTGRHFEYDLNALWELKNRKPQDSRTNPCKQRLNNCLKCTIICDSYAGGIAIKCFLLLFSDGLLRGPWIGLNDKKQEGNLQWSDGTPMSYMPANAVNNVIDNSDCIQLKKQGNFKIKSLSRICTRMFSFICKKKSE